NHEGVLHIIAMHNGSPYSGPQNPLQATSSRLTKDKNPLQSSNLTRASSWGLMISLSIHGLIEGIPVSAASDHIDSPLAWSPLLLGILLHKAPTTFALAALLLRQKATPLLLCQQSFGFLAVLPWAYGSVMASDIQAMAIEKYFML
ncbi:MAG: hypothetical protein ACKO7X_08270, partial [Bacteroidota bacterium]